MGRHSVPGVLRNRQNPSLGVQYPKGYDGTCSTETVTDADTVEAHHGTWESTTGHHLILVAQMNRRTCKSYVNVAIVERASVPRTIMKHAYRSMMQRNRLPRLWSSRRFYPEMLFFKPALHLKSGIKMQRDIIPIRREATVNER